MLLTGRLLSIILIVALLTPISLSRNFEQLVTSTQTSTMNVSYATTNSSVSTFSNIRNVTVTSVSTVFAGITGTLSSNLCSYSEWGSFHANASQILSASFVASLPLDVYVITYQQFLDMVNLSACSPISALAVVRNVTSYQLSMVMPYSDDFALLFVNHSLMTVTLNVLSIELSSVTVKPESVTAYVTTYQPFMTNTIELVTSTFTTQQPEQTQYAQIITVAAVAGFAVAVVGYFSLKRKSTGP